MVLDGSAGEDPDNCYIADGLPERAPHGVGVVARAPQAEAVTREALRTVDLEKGWSGKVYEPARYEGAAKPEPEPRKVTPKGAVRAGAGAAGTSGEGAALIAGGVGLAAAGAAGLGFTMLRRRRAG
ncbi:hypothetical protein [Streptomyces sp. NPDC057686]|uniref:hypothetical protein n=1 Tax=Streptomyces sp. NPDC057686 TaxID=3346212 RepID=UPI00368FB21E